MRILLLCESSVRRFGKKKIKHKTKLCTQFCKLVADGCRETLKERKKERKESEKRASASAAATAADPAVIFPPLSPTCAEISEDVERLATHTVIRLPCS